MKLAVRKAHRKLYMQLRYYIIEPAYDFMEKLFPDFIQDFYPFKEHGYRPRFYYPGRDWWELGTCSYEIKQKYKDIRNNIYEKLQNETGKKLLSWFINNNCGKCLTKTPISGRIRNRTHPVTYYEMFTVFGYCQIKQIKYNTETQKGINLFSEGLLTALINASNGEEYKDEKITTETEIIWRGFLTRKGFLQAMRAFWKKYDGTVW